MAPGVTYWWPRVPSGYVTGMEFQGYAPHANSFWFRVNVRTGERGSGIDRSAIHARHVLS